MLNILRNVSEVSFISYVELFSILPLAMISLLGDGFESINVKKFFCVIGILLLIIQICCIVIRVCTLIFGG